MVYGQQLNRRDSQLVEMLDGGVGRQPAVGPAQFLGDAGMLLRKAFDVQLVDDRLFPRRAGAPVVAPVKARIGYRRQRGERGAVPIVQLVDRVRRLRQPVHRREPKHGIVPAQPAAHCSGVRVEEHFLGVEAVTLVGMERAFHAVGVELSGLNVGNVGVPNLVGPAGELHEARLDVALDRIKKTQENPLGVGGKDREVNALAVPGGA